MRWYSFSISEVAKYLNTSLEGLTSDDALSRIKKFGKNEISDGKSKHRVWSIIWSQFKDFMIVILIIAAIISGLTSDLSDTIIILSIVIINAIIGFVQEFRAEKALESLKKLANSRIEVFRDKEWVKIDSTELVPGDVVNLNAGDIIPADVRFISTFSFHVDESALTGESQNIEKNCTTLDYPNLALADRLNMSYKGTSVTSGRASAFVVETGINTELGRIAKLIQRKESISPLQKRLKIFGKNLSIIIIILCTIIFFAGWLRGENLINMLLLSLSLAVAAIPEALPALVTISLAMGAKKLVKQNVLVRKLHAVETLGSVNFICSDKTGTLTKNKMSVEKVFEIENELKKTKVPDDLLLISMALNNDVKQNEEKEWIGESTEKAIFNYALSKNFYKKELEKIYPRIGEIPFDSKRKCMSTLHQIDGAFLVICKGALEMVLKKTNSKDNTDLKEIEKQANKLSGEGYRIIAFAYKIVDKLPEIINPNDIENSLTILGFAAMIDPPREEVKEAILKCKEAGINTVMITGDHKLTATAIANSLGIIDKEEDLVLSGTEIGNLNEDEFSKIVECVKVYARVDPEQKLKIVNALQNKGHYVAMTGDGVNDAPALKHADIGIAMGINGTEVSKEAAHMILLDDKFQSIVNAIQYGRQIFDNILKFIKYILTGNSGEIWVIILAPFLGLPIPLLPIHILWVNLVSDGLPGLALASEGAESNIMKQKVRKSTDSIFDKNMVWHIFWVGLLMGIITLGTFAWELSKGNPKAQTMAFSVLCFCQLGHALAIKSNDVSIFKSGFLKNKAMLWATFLSISFQLTIIYTPFFNEIFKIKSLSILELTQTIVISSVIFLVVEIAKYLRYKKNS